MKLSHERGASEEEASEATSLHSQLHVKQDWNCRTVDVYQSFEIQCGPVALQHKDSGKCLERRENSTVWGPVLENCDGSLPFLMVWGRTHMGMYLKHIESGECLTASENGGNPKFYQFTDTCKWADISEENRGHRGIFFPLTTSFYRSGHILPYSKPVSSGGVSVGPELKVNESVQLWNKRAGQCIVPEEDPPAHNAEYVVSYNGAASCRVTEDSKFLWKIISVPYTEISPYTDVQPETSPNTEIRVISNGPGCSTGDITDMNQCRDAARALGYTWRNSNGVEGQWTHAPKGCHVGLVEGKWDHLYFNTVADMSEYQAKWGGSRSIYRSICQR
jgi:hypothetical protein